MFRNLMVVMVWVGLLSGLGCSNIQQNFKPVEVKQNAPTTNSQQNKRYVPAISEDVSRKLKNILILLNPLDPAESDDVYERAIILLGKVLDYCEATCNGNEYAQIYIELAWVNAELGREFKTLEYYNLVLEQAPQISYGLEAIVLMDAVRLNANYDDGYKVDAYLNRLARINSGRYENTCYRLAETLYKRGEYQKGLVSINNCIESAERINNGFVVPREAYETKLALMDALAITDGRGAIVDKLSVTSGRDDYRSIFKLSPAYPIEAIASETEGFCTVQYDILTNGRTENVVAVECPNSIFEENSIKTAKNFLYKPQFINGEAAVVTGVRNKFLFELAR